MISGFRDVLPVLRTQKIARHDTATFHCEARSNRVGATPRVAFTVGHGLVTRDEVAGAGVSGEDLLAAAVANLKARRAAWTVEAATGGFLGFGKTPTVLSYTDPFAAEMLLVSDFVSEAHRRILPKERMHSRVGLFAPRRGQLRAVLAKDADFVATDLVAREREAAKAAWEAAGADAVCPAQIEPSSYTGRTFIVGSRFAGEEELYAPPLEQVRVIVVAERDLRHRTNGPAAPKRPLEGSLRLVLGVREVDGAQTLLTEPMLDELGLSFDHLVDELLPKIPALPVSVLGTFGPGLPIVGFEGSGAMDQLANGASLARLHAALGDPYVLLPYSATKVWAAPARLRIKRSNLYELVEFCDPTPPTVLVTLDLSGCEFYTVFRGRVTGLTPWAD